MAKNSISIIVAIILLFSLVIILNASIVNAYLAPIPEVGPGVCAWKQPNGQPCNERIQRCDKGCPPLRGMPSISPPSSYDQSTSSTPSSSQPSSSSSCSSAISFCYSECIKSKEEFSVCQTKCIARKMGTVNKRTFTKCLQSLSSYLSSLKTRSTGPAIPQGIEGLSKDRLNKLNKNIYDNLVTINNVFYSKAGKNAFVLMGYKEWIPGDRFNAHNTGNAVDVSLEQLKFRDQIKVFKELKKRLGEKFHVCFETSNIADVQKELDKFECIIQIGKNEKPHIHVEYDAIRAKSLELGEVPPPKIITNSETPATEKYVTIKRAIDAFDLQFGQRQTLYDDKINVPGGFYVRVTTSQKDVILWGAEIIGTDLALRLAKYALPKAIRADILEQAQRELEIAQKDLEVISPVFDVAEINPKITGNRVVGPVTFELIYGPEVMPEHYEGKNLGLFHATVDAGKTVITQVQKVVFNPATRMVSGQLEELKREGNKLFVALIPEQTKPAKPTTGGDTRTYQK